MGQTVRRYMPWALAVALCVGLSSPASGGKWPKPAAGPSASGDPELILTFDDGPHEDYTPAILDELQRRGLKAHFFWVGHRVTGQKPAVGQRIALVDRAVRDGMLIGNHTINHAQLCAGSPAQAAREIDENRRIYEDLTGMPIHWFRAPYGAKCDRLIRMLNKRGLDHFHWDMDPRDWEHRDSSATLEYVVKKLRNLEGRGVLIMHDTKKSSVRALPKILDWIDGENRRRRRRGEPQIRILSFVDLAREQLAPGLDALGAQLAERGAEVRGRLRALVPDLRAPTM